MQMIQMFAECLQTSERQRSLGVPRCPRCRSEALPQETRVVAHNHLRFDLLDGIEHDADDDQ